MNSLRGAIATACAAVAMVLILIGIAFADPEPASLHAPPGSTTASVVSKLIEQLGSDSVQDRDTAQKQLLDLGSSIQPELKKAAENNDDPEVRSRAAAIISQLKDQVQNQSTLITLHVKSAAPQEVLNMIGTQAHSQLTVSGMMDPTPNRQGHTVTLDVDQQPFWDVMSQVCGQLNICPVVSFNQANAMRFRPAWENWMAKSPHQIVGPYWLSILSLTHTRISSLAGDPVIHDQFTVNMIVYPEPRLMVTHLSDFKVEEATDDAGHSMMPRPLPPNVQLPMRRAQSMNHSIEFVLAYPQEQAGSKIAILRGNLEAVVAQDLQHYKIEDVLGTPVVSNPLQGADVSVHVVPQGSEYHVDLKCTRAKLAQDKWNALVNCTGDMTLEDAQGRALTAIRPFGVHSMSEAPGLEFVSGDATFSSGSPYTGTQSTTSKVAGPLRLQWNLPQSLKTINIEATFKDLQMP